WEGYASLPCHRYSIATPAGRALLSEPHPVTPCMTYIRQGLDDICARRTQALAEACFSETLDFGTPPGVTKSRSRGSENPLVSDPESTSLAVAPTLRIRHRPFRNGLSSNWLG